jgi:hypothetical protein
MSVRQAAVPAPVSKSADTLNNGSRYVEDTLNEINEVTQRMGREDIYGPTPVKFDEWGAPIWSEADELEKEMRNGNEGALLLECNTVDLSYRHNPPMAANEAIRWLSALSINRTVLSFNIGGNNVPRAFPKVGQLLEYNSTLTHLDIHGNDIGDAGCASLALGLRGVTEGVEGTTLAKPNIVLTSLNVCWNKITDIGMKKLANAIGQNTSVISLNLSHNEITWCSAEMLGGMLRQNETLTCLDLEYNNLRASGAESIALGLNIPHGSTIATLNLSGNDIGDKGVAEIALALSLCHGRGESFSSLTELNLSHNLISSVGMRSISLVLLANENRITHLGLNGNHHSNSGELTAPSATMEPDRYNY